MNLIIKFLWPYRWLILAYSLVLVFAGLYVHKSHEYTEFRLSTALEETERKESIIRYQTQVNNLTKQMDDSLKEVEVKYESKISQLRDDISNADATISRLSKTNSDIRASVTSSASCPESVEYTTTYIDLYEELRQFASTTSEAADRATEEAIRQHDRSQAIVDEYNRFKLEQSK